MKISIAMTYFNRKDQLLRTLKSLTFFQENIHEVIIVDDASHETQKIDYINDFNFKIKLVEIPPEKKTYLNCCIPFNIALRMCEGDAIIIQNSECYHAADILTYTKENLTYGKYLSFSCYSLSELNTVRLPDFSRFSKDQFIQFNKDFLSPLAQRSADGWGECEAWYNHPQYRPCDLHFTTAITKQDLEELNYFDERYAQCVAFDDNEILQRIKRKGMHIDCIASPLSVHQFHYQTNYVRGAMCEQLFHEVTMKETGWRVNE